jgi:hypothetical protein
MRPLPDSVIVERVLRPAILGRPIEIGRPFGPRRAKLAAERAELVEILVEDLGERVRERIRRVAAVDDRLLPTVVEPGVVALAARGHDLAAVYHGDLVGLFSSDARERLLAATIRGFEAMTAPATLRAALLRFAWLGALPRWTITRTDLRWWTGSASFVGRPPPPRLYTWKELRRVRASVTRVELLRAPALLAAGGATPGVVPAALHARALSAFFVANPIADLVHAGRTTPAFSWTPSLARLVATAAGARIARRAIALGEEGGRFAREVVSAVAGGAARAIL